MEGGGGGREAPAGHGEAGVDQPHLGWRRSGGDQGKVKAEIRGDQWKVMGDMTRSGRSRRTARGAKSPWLRSESSAPPEAGPSSPASSPAV